MLSINKTYPARASPFHNAMRLLHSSTVCAAVAAVLDAQIPASTIFNPAPSRIAGQAVLQQIGVLTATAPNLVEGREFNGPQAVALDSSVTPSILYVADTGNNRVLAWKNATAFSKGNFADQVIGQRDFLSTSPKGPGSDLSTGLAAPDALAVDKHGNLYVLDAGNNRILRYPPPLAQTGVLLAVDLIIGQKDLNGISANEGQTAPSAKTLAVSLSGNILRSGMAFDAQGNLWVSDAGNNRILRFPAGLLGTKPSNEPAADLVLGQADFVSSQTPSTASQSKCGTATVTSQRCGDNFLIQPAGLGFDAAGRLFVADNLNRVVVYTPPFSTGQFIARIMGVVLPTTAQPVPPGDQRKHARCDHCRRQRNTAVRRVLRRRHSLCNRYGQLQDFGIHFLRPMAGPSHGLFTCCNGCHWSNQFPGVPGQSKSAAAQRFYPK